eukprot:6475868-Prymnesium_polylepis.2
MPVMPDRRTAPHPTRHTAKGFSPPPHCNLHAMHREQATMHQTPQALHKRVHRSLPLNSRWEPISSISAP